MTDPSCVYMQGFALWATDNHPPLPKNNKPRPPPPSSGAALSSAEMETIETFIRSTLRSGKTVNYPMVHAELSKRRTFKLNLRQLRKRMAKLGYVWGKAKVMPRANLALPEWAAKRYSYALAYARALALQREGIAKIVYMDETYVNVRHKRAFTLYHPDSAQGNRVQAGVGGGELVIIVHAMTEDGLLACEEVDEKKQPTGKLVRPDYDKSGEAQFTCEMIWRAKSLPSIDYHSHFDADTMQRWVKDRLLPTFHRKYPGKQLILVLDNAKYHRANGPDYISPASATKPDLIAMLKKWGIQSVTVQRPVKEEEKKQQKKKGKKGRRGKKRKKNKSSDDEEEEMLDDGSDSEASNLRLVAEYEERQNEVKERDIIKEAGGDEQRKREQKEEKQRKQEEKKLRPMEPRVFHPNQWEGRGGDKGPTREELVVVAKAHLDANPLLCRSAIQIMFDDEVHVLRWYNHLLICCTFVVCCGVLQSTQDRENGKTWKHELLYTVPYESDSQPIEKLWSVVKQNVAGNHEAKRTPSQLLEQTFAAFYGGGTQTPGIKHTTINAALCQRFIKSAYDTVNPWLAEWQQRSGSSICTTVLGAGKTADMATLTSTQAAQLQSKYSKASTLVINFDSDDDEDVADVEPDIPDPADNDF